MKSGEEVLSLTTSTMTYCTQSEREGGGRAGRWVGGRERREGIKLWGEEGRRYTDG